MVEPNRRSRLSLLVGRYPVWLSFLTVGLTLAAVELLLLNKSLRLRAQPVSVWAHAITDEDGSIRYDPKIGVRLSQTPGEIGYWTSRHGWVFKNELRGNNFGFSDTKDFSPAKPDPSTFRFLVFGDSFTANLFLDESWPQVVDASLADEGIELYNVAIDGSGFPTWWRILRNVVIEHQFEIDAIVLAVCCDNVHRHHYWLHDTLNRQEGRHHTLSIYYESGRSYAEEDISTPDAVGRSDAAFGWMVFEEGLPTHEEMRKLVLAHHEWDHFFLRSLVRVFLPGIASASSRDDVFRNESYLAMVEDFRRYADQRGIPIHAIALEKPEGFTELVELLEVDDWVSSEGVRRRSSHSLPLDGHWTEEGARAVGEYLTPYFRRWAQSAREREGSR